MNNPTTAPDDVWAAFVTFAEANGISLESDEDWRLWWDCFREGVLFVTLRR